MDFGMQQESIRILKKNALVTQQAFKVTSRAAINKSLPLSKSAMFSF